MDEQPSPRCKDYPSDAKRKGVAQTYPQDRLSGHANEETMEPNENEEKDPRKSEHYCSSCDSDGCTCGEIAAFYESSDEQ